MCTNMFAQLLKILCQTYIAFDQNIIIYDKKKQKQNFGGDIFSVLEIYIFRPYYSL